MLEKVSLFAPTVPPCMKIEIQTLQIYLLRAVFLFSWNGWVLHASGMRIAPTEAKRRLPISAPESLRSILSGACMTERRMAQIQTMHIYLQWAMHAKPRKGLPQQPFSMRGYTHK
ncbi:MAG: hypothetical protein LUI87_19290 [Lachnospiraceae bacterium]|nr:hypothetical protein [Lachnospiraceae bacterium]